MLFKKIEMKSAPQFKAASVIYQITYLLSSFQSSKFPSMSYTEMFGKRHTEFALSLFCRSAVKVLNEQGLKDTPSEEQLFELIIQDVFGDQEEDSSPPKNVPCDENAKKVEVSEIPVAEVPKKITNLSSKDLKKNPLKITKKQLNKDGTEDDVEVEIAFPYLSGVDYSETCQSLKVNGGLFTPCLTRPAKDSQFCKTCAKSNHKYGTLEQRSNCAMLCYTDPHDKKEISFGTWLKKRGLERGQVESKIEEEYGITLPEEYWVLDKSKASRAVKTVSTSSDDEASVEGEKSASKKRGRPNKKTNLEASDDKASVECDKLAPKESGFPKNVTVASPSHNDETELVEEPVDQDEDLTQKEEHQEPVADILMSIKKKKNGSLKKIDADHCLVVWDNETYIIDMEDNGLWTHDENLELLTCVGDWNPETKKLSFDED